MKIYLSLEGGIYGILDLEPVDIFDEKLAFPEPLRQLVQSSALEAHKEAPGERATPDGSLRGQRTESEVYRLKIVHPDGKEANYAFSKSVTEQEADLKQLVDFIWSVAKPIPNE